MCVWSGQVTVRPVGNLLVDFVGEADAKLQHVALDRGQVADALDLQLLLVAFVTPSTMLLISARVRPCRRATVAVLALARDDDRLAVVFDGDVDLGPMRRTRACRACLRR